MSRFRGSTGSVPRRLSFRSVSTPTRDGLLRRRRGAASLFPSCAGRPGTRETCSCSELYVAPGASASLMSQGQSRDASAERPFRGHQPIPDGEPEAQLTAECAAISGRLGRADSAPHSAVVRLQVDEPTCDDSVIVNRVARVWATHRSALVGPRLEAVTSRAIFSPLQYRLVRRGKRWDGLPSLRPLSRVV